MDNIDGSHYLCELIKNLNTDRNLQVYAGDFTVTAIVGGKEMISGDLIKCQLTIKHDSVDISIYWEECGYKGFREMGLYGRTNSNYFAVEELSKSSFKIIDNKVKSNQIIFEW